MEDLSLHILDVVENSTRAGATLVEISLIEDRERDLILLSIKDNGKGMESDLLQNVRDPFTTTRTTRRVGLGVSFLDQAAREAGGGLTISSTPGAGTEIAATFVASHIDRKPLGDLGSTMTTLILGNPEIEFVVRINADGVTADLDTREIKTGLDGVSITHPTVLSYIKTLFTQL
jgi:signal transduction histidine kinase